MPYEPPAVTGIETSSKVIGKKALDIKANISTGLEKCANVILKKALQWVPVDTEALKRSGHVEVSGTGKGSRARVVFGGRRDTYYALYVHENLQAFHKPPTCAKFLEKAARDRAGTMASIVASELMAGRSKAAEAAAVAAGKPGGTGYTLVTDTHHATKYMTGSGSNVAYQTHGK